MSLSIPFPLGWLLNKKAARVEVNISLAFLHSVGIALHPWPFISDIAIFVLKGDVKLQLTCSWVPGRWRLLSVLYYTGAERVNLWIDDYISRHLASWYCATPSVIYLYRTCLVDTGCLSFSHYGMLMMLVGHIASDAVM